MEGQGGGNKTERGKEEVLHFFYDASHVCPCHCIHLSPLAPATGPHPHSRMVADDLTGLRSILSTQAVFYTTLIFSFSSKTCNARGHGS